MKYIGDERTTWWKAKSLPARGVAPEIIFFRCHFFLTAPKVFEAALSFLEIERFLMQRWMTLLFQHTLSRYDR